MSPYLDLCAAISKEVAAYSKAGASLKWGRASATYGEAIIRRGDVEERVYIARSPSRHDKASAIGRVRRALRKIGVQDVGEAPVAEPPKVKPKKKRKRPPRTHERRIKALEVALAAAVERIAALEAAQTGRAA